MNVLQSAINLNATTDVRPSARVEVFDPLENPAYEEMLTTCPDSNAFHSQAWLRVIRDTYGHRPLCFAAHSPQGEVLAMLPVTEVRSWLTHKRGVMLPFADFCPPLASNTTLYELLFNEALKYGQKQRWAYLELRGGRNLMPRARASVEYYAHVLNLSAGLDKTFARFEGNLRRGIRKAEREGVRVEVSNTLQAMQIYYALHCETRKKHGVPPQPFSFFLNLFNQMIAQEAGIVVVARHQNVPIAAAVFIHRGSNAIYKFSASDPAFVALRGNNLLLWEAIKWYIGCGASSMHFGRSSLKNEGLRTYKSVWGTEETLLEYFKYDLRKKDYGVDRDRSEGGLARLLGCLPGPLFRLAGRILYRHLS